MENDLLQDYAACFSAEDNLTCFEMWNFQDAQKDICAPGPVVINKAGSVTIGHTYEDAIEGLVVIFSEGVSLARRCSVETVSSQLFTSPMRMRSETFKSIKEAFSLPGAYLQMMREASTVFVDMQNISSGACHNASNFMMQNSFTATSQFSVSLSHYSKRHLTQALVHGLSKNEQNILVEKLKAHRNDIGLPLLLPSLLLTFRVDSATSKVKGCHQEIVVIEHETGIQTKWHSDDPCCSGRNRQRLPQKRYEQIDFDKITADLTSLNSKLAFIEYMCEVHLPMLDQFDAIHSQIVESTTEQSEKAKMQQVQMRLKMELNMLRSSLQATLARAKYLSKRGQSLVQTIYSLIAQKDNALSIRDNIQLKAISEDQKRIALLAKRDSAAMRVVSVVTALLLPATFTATLFSTTFFDFQAGQVQHVLVSQWIWLYFLVTILVSGLIGAWWRYLSVQSQHTLDKELHEYDDRMPDMSVESDSASMVNGEKAFPS